MKVEVRVGKCQEESPVLHCLRDLTAQDTTPVCNQGHVKYIHDAGKTTLEVPDEGDVSKIRVRDGPVCSKCLKVLQTEHREAPQGEAKLKLRYVSPEEKEDIATSYDILGPMRKALVTQFGVAAGEGRLATIPEWPVVEKKAKDFLEHLQWKVADNVSAPKPAEWWTEQFTLAAEFLIKERGVKLKDVSAELLKVMPVGKTKLLRYLPDKYKNPEKVAAGKKGGRPARFEKTDINAVPPRVVSPGTSPPAHVLAPPAMFEAVRLQEGRRRDLPKEDPDKKNFGIRCRVCGCSEDDACEGGCSWVERDICSQCILRVEKSGQGGGQELWYHFALVAPIGFAKEPGPNHVFDVTVPRHALQKAAAARKKDGVADRDIFVDNCMVRDRGLKKGQ